MIQDGRFVWAHPHSSNNADKHPFVDTTPGKWIDSDGRGIYPRPAGQPARVPDGKKKLKEDFIYVSDDSYRIYIGIKQRGRLQHSSFLAGGPISSAGTLVVGAEPGLLGLPARLTQEQKMVWRSNSVRCQVTTAQKRTPFSGS